MSYGDQSISSYETRKIILVRHFSTTWNPESFHAAMDPPLSGIAVQQTEALASVLGAYNFDLVYCSELVRTQETARLLSIRIPLPEFKIDKNLNELHAIGC